MAMPWTTDSDEGGEKQSRSADFLKVKPKGFLEGTSDSKRGVKDKFSKWCWES